MQLISKYDILDIGNSILSVVCKSSNILRDVVRRWVNVTHLTSGWDNGREFRRCVRFPVVPSD